MVNRALMSPILSTLNILVGPHQHHYNAKK